MNIQRVSPNFCARMKYKGPCRWASHGRAGDERNEARFDSDWVREERELKNKKGIELLFKNCVLFLYGVTLKDYYAAVEEAEKLAEEHKSGGAYVFPNYSQSMSKQYLA